MLSNLLQSCEYAILYTCKWLYGVILNFMYFAVFFKKKVTFSQGSYFCKGEFMTWKPHGATQLPVQHALLIQAFACTVPLPGAPPTTPQGTSLSSML
jgi:hypothetical protein